MMNIILLPKVDKYLAKQYKGDNNGIHLVRLFIADVLTGDNPCALPNAKKMQGYAGNCWRWKVGDYRIIGKVNNAELVIEIIKIAHRKEVYK